MAVLAECCCSTYFYPRPPRGGRRERIIFAPAIDRFLSTPSARRATPKKKNPPMLQTISIHALREEGDPKPDHEWPGIHVISIHALREEGDQSFQFAMQTVK